MVYKQYPVTGKLSGLLAELKKSDIANIDIKKKGFRSIVTITFSDGGVMELDGPVGQKFDLFTAAVS